MITFLFIIVFLLLAASLGIQIAIWKRASAGIDFTPLGSRFDVLQSGQERGERLMADSFARLNQDTLQQARAQREELQSSLKNSTDLLVQSVDKISSAQHRRLEDFADRLTDLKSGSDTAGTQLRQELGQMLEEMKQAQEQRLLENAKTLQQLFEDFGRRLTDFQNASVDQQAQGRTELSTALKDVRDTIQQQLTDAMTLQQKQSETFATHINRLTEASEKKSDELRTAVEGKLEHLQKDNAAKLEEMRETVDEKLQGTLDKRLGESFKLVSDRLEQVHKGLGEMQVLATGVGDLKRVLTNVKVRGTWSEMQLGTLLEQVLVPDQFARNVATKPGSRENVEFAIKLPGRDQLDGQIVWLPIDAKFPKEDYERLVEASERGDPVAEAQAGKELEARIRSQARDIRDKYLAPPHTTDFGLLYLPTEGLYAEVVRRPILVDALQREFRVTVVGPITLGAILNSLQMGFRSLAIQKQSSEVWKVLGAVKSEFGKFGDTLEKVKRKLDETGSTIEDAAHRSRQIEKRLRKVEALPAVEAAALLGDRAAVAGSADENEKDDSPLMRAAV